MVQPGPSTLGNEQNICWVTQTAAEVLGEVEDLKDQLAAAAEAKTVAEREAKRAAAQLKKLQAQAEKVRYSPMMQLILPAETMSGSQCRTRGGSLGRPRFACTKKSKANNGIGNPVETLILCTRELLAILRRVPAWSGR